MKTLLSLLAMLFAVNFSYAQNSNPWPTSGNVGIGTITPGEALTIQRNSNIGGLGIRGSSASWIGNDVILSRANSGNQIGRSPNIMISDAATGYASMIASYQGMLQFWSNTNGSWAQAMNVVGANVGVGTQNPLGTFQVNDFYRKVVLGDASGTGLVNGTSYIGFNAVRMSNSNWRCYGDATSDGGAVIYGDTNGNLNFVAISSANGSNYADYPDATIKSKVVFQITPAGVAHAKVVKVDQVNWPDYVFKSTYKLPSLSEVKTYIDQNQHLPEMPSAAEIEKDGANLGELVKLQTKKIEELTLYLIEQNNKLDKQQTVNVSQQALLNQLQQKIIQLEQKQSSHN